MTPREIASSLGGCIDALDRSYLDSGGCKARGAIKELARRIDAEGIDAPDVLRGDALQGDGFVVLPIARFDELRQAEEDLQDVRVAADEEDEPLHPPLAMSHMQDMQKQVEVLAGRIDGLYDRVKERADANRDFAVGVGARFKDQGERITMHHERAEEFDRRLRSFGARLAEVERTIPHRREVGRVVRDGPIPDHGGPAIDRGEKIEIR